MLAWSLIMVLSLLKFTIVEYFDVPQYVPNLDFVYKVWFWNSTVGMFGIKTDSVKNKSNKF